MIHRGGSEGSTDEAGALGFRDFPGLLVTKENRNGSHQTLHSQRPVCRRWLYSLTGSWKGRGPRVRIPGSAACRLPALNA
jgi:hypothetical protein